MPRFLLAIMVVMVWRAVLPVGTTKEAECTEDAWGRQQEHGVQTLSREGGTDEARGGAGWGTGTSTGETQGDDTGTTDEQTGTREERT